MINKNLHRNRKISLRNFYSNAKCIRLGKLIWVSAARAAENPLKMISKVEEGRD